jgi:hypothetical protein
MTDHALRFKTEIKGLEASEWYEALEELVEEHGSFTPLGRDHVATFLDAGPKLLVTFEHAEEVQELNDAAPRGFAFTQREGWSHLAIISRGDSWFRDPAVYRYIDRLIDDGFFEDFEDVLFFGAQAGGYAAAAYSVAAPGARVLALRPQATLDPTTAGWDNRFIAQRRLNFTDRYGYAPDMVDASKQTYIVFNPQQRFDAMHAALFTKPNVTMLRVMGLNGRLDVMFDTLGGLDDMIRAAMAGELTPQRFIQALAARKTFAPYLRNLVRRARDSGHARLAAVVCRTVLDDGHDAFFIRQLQDMGEPLPEAYQKDAVRA